MHRNLASYNMLLIRIVHIFETFSQPISCRYLITGPLWELTRAQFRTSIAKAEQRITKLNSSNLLHTSLRLIQVLASTHWLRAILVLLRTLFLLLP
jgi:hypothetical protein